MESSSFLLYFQKEGRLKMNAEENTDLEEIAFVAFVLIVYAFLFGVIIGLITR